MLSKATSQAAKSCKIVNPIDNLYGPVYLEAMIPRELEAALRLKAGTYPVVAVTGPRQSGKTTLVRAAFPEYAYVSLEDPDKRLFATTDPRRFLANLPGPAILDEIQRVPELTSYIQGIVDSEGRAGRFVITGSSNLLLLDQVSQSLAGRTALLTLLPFSTSELAGAGGPQERLENMLFAGFYPRIHHLGLPPGPWYRDYVSTYLEKDVRNVLNVSDVGRFHLFLKMCAARSGQLLNLSALGNDCGITHNTARSWLSVLEASYIVHQLRPHFVNFRKRLVKATKLYFLDPGLLCHLLEIDSPDQLTAHSSRGAIFEGWVVSELLKSRLHRDLEPRLHFWRDYKGREVDIIVGSPPNAVPVEVKSGSTVAQDFFKGLNYWSQLAGTSPHEGWVVYGGDEDQNRSDGRVLSWRSIDKLTEAIVSSSG